MVLFPRGIGCRCDFLRNKIFRQQSDVPEALDGTEEDFETTFGRIASRTRYYTSIPRRSQPISSSDARYHLTIFICIHRQCGAGGWGGVAHISIHSSCDAANASRIRPEPVGPAPEFISVSGMTLTIQALGLTASGFSFSSLPNFIKLEGCTS